MTFFQESGLSDIPRKPAPLIEGVMALNTVRQLASKKGLLNFAKDTLNPGQQERLADLIFQRAFKEALLDLISQNAPGTPDAMAGTGQRVAVSALEIWGTVTDLGGIADILVGALGLKTAIANKDRPGIVSNSFGIAAGFPLTISGALGTAGLVARLPLMLATAVAPLLLVGAVLGLVSIFVTAIMDKHDQKMHDATENQTQWLRDLANDGLAAPDWSERLEYLRYALSVYRYDNTDPDQSYFEFQENEWLHFLRTPGENGSSLNRLNADLHRYTEKKPAAIASCGVAVVRLKDKLRGPGLHVQHGVAPFLQTPANSTVGCRPPAEIAKRNRAAGGLASSPPCPPHWAFCGQLPARMHVHQAGAVASLRTLQTPYAFFGLAGLRRMLWECIALSARTDTAGQSIAVRASQNKPSMWLGIAVCIRPVTTAHLEITMPAVYVDGSAVPQTLREQ